MPFWGQIDVKIAVRRPFEAPSVVGTLGVYGVVKGNPRAMGWAEGVEVK
jgi:hypothetical protein